MAADIPVTSPGNPVQGIVFHAEGPVHVALASERGGRVPD